MAHWAEIDNDNKVIRVLVGDNNDPAGDEGYKWLVDNLGGRWMKTSYNSNIRKNFAGIEFTYDEQRDAFIPPKPESNPLNENGNEINGQWVLNEDTCLWDFTPEE